MMHFWSGFLTYATPEFLFLLPAQVCLLLLPRPPAFAKRLLALVLFCVGHGIVFVVLSAAALPGGQTAVEHQAWIARVGGLAMILAGLLPGRVWAVALGAFGGGVTIASVWPPSSGPVLGETMLLANSPETLGQGLIYLTLHASGFCLSFLLAGLLLDGLLSIPPLGRWRGARGLSTSGPRHLEVTAPGILYAVMGAVAVTGLTGTVSLWLLLRSEPWVDWLSRKGL